MAAPSISLMDAPLASRQALSSGPQLSELPEETMPLLSPRAAMRRSADGDCTDQIPYLRRRW